MPELLVQLKEITDVTAETAERSSAKIIIRFDKDELRVTDFKIISDVGKTA